MEKKRLLYFCFNRSSFVERDIAILNSSYEVIVFAKPAPKPFDILTFIFLQFFFLIGKIWNADILVCQFAGHHSVLPVFFGKIFRRPVLIIPGGSDCVSFPSIHYGNYRKKFLSKTSNYSYRHATHIAPVDESLLYSRYTYTNDDFPVQGIRHFCKSLPTPTTVIHNGFDATFFQAEISNRDPKSFLTVATGGESENVFRLKGLDLIIELASHFQECNFTIVGVTKLPVQTIPENVKLIPYISLEEMSKLMNTQTFYLQLSISEGFPNALCEAMLCGCIPIVSHVASMPEIIGDSGFVLEKRDLQLLKNVIGNVLKSDLQERSAKARKRIAENYSLEKRKEELLGLMKQLVLNKPAN